MSAVAIVAYAREGGWRNELVLKIIGAIDQFSKKVLSQISPSRNPSDEHIRSLLIEIENVVNSRPLTYVGLGSCDDDALTPNHFY